MDANGRRPEVCQSVNQTSDGCKGNVCLSLGNVCDVHPLSLVFFIFPAIRAIWTQSRWRCMIIKQEVVILEAMFGCQETDSPS